MLVLGSQSPHRAQGVGLEASFARAYAIALSPRDPLRNLKRKVARKPAGAASKRDWLEIEIEIEIEIVSFVIEMGV